MIKKISLIALAFMIAASALMAQPKPPSPEDQAAHLKEKLGLNDDQTAKVESILKASHEKMEAQMEASKESREADREAFKKMMDETNDKIMSVLTDEQKTEYKKFMEERKGMMRKGPGPKEGN